MRRPTTLILLATIAFLMAPSAAKDNGWLQPMESVAGIGTEPGQPTPAQAEGAVPATARQAADADADTGDRTLRAETVPGQAQTRAPEALEKAKPIRGTELAGPLVAQASMKPWREREARTAAETRPWRSGEASGDKGRETETAQPATATAGAARRQENASAPKTIRLFGTMAFRGNFDALPKWKRVLSKADAQVRALDSCTSGKGCPPGTASWQRIMSQARGLGPMEQLKTVNTFFNKWPYRLDQDVYGTSDWWATPQEFLKLSGDCEDYAITKYYALRDLGHSPDNLRIVVLRDRIRGIAHAILVVILDGDAYVLDNVSSVVFSHDKYSHYVPYYSLNEKYRWSHIPVDKKP